MSALLLAGCQSATTDTAQADATSAAALLLPGSWHGELATQGPSNSISIRDKDRGNNPVVYLLNQGLDGEERLRCNEITAAGDSVTIRLHVFDAALVVRADGQNKLKGTWVKYDTKEPYRVPLTATLGQQPLFAETAGAAAAFTGNWRTTFTNEKGHAYPAVGIFKQTGAALTGTFLTTTGDYRYLAGRVDGNGLRLSTFDGNPRIYLWAKWRRARRQLPSAATTIPAKPATAPGLLPSTLPPSYPMPTRLPTSKRASQS
ncbi:MAG: hypothetical protein WKG07_48395 [Hymenobacter sp.]